MHQALGTTNYDSMAQFWEHHGIVDKAEYISVLRAGTPRPPLMLPRTVQRSQVRTERSVYKGRRRCFISNDGDKALVLGKDNDDPFPSEAHYGGEVQKEHVRRTLRAPRLKPRCAQRESGCYNDDACDTGAEGVIR
ncbi:hypothetical protein HPB52_010816 [Rhipicephalus sanguineus]|uniref:Uncharacterized protein n=1 Tax=Rhipicephalus sanguineus TaxID=34632 RepID=A0A9D4T9F9_RHISA|nr:hypothetical protein HPB52_010816 [Rhipicephalus sanguineus]